MQLHPGARLGTYHVIAPIGAGGMGEVYRARDARLGRDVAIKILPEVFARDAERRTRFHREATVLASLNHPHIAQIYGLEEHGGAQALVMELVEGSTLADRIARGPLPLDDTLAIALQIADALDAAHAQGIIHRDLKPANIKLRSDGTVKVLDFGLAKTIESASENDAGESPTITGTRAGVILGTAAYMSPEQARGAHVDKRTDIWAFGCVLYEMLTGRPAFARDTVTDTIATVITSAPDLSLLPALTPAAVRRLLGRCLEKDAKRRLRDIGDACFEVEHARTQPAEASVQQPRQRGGGLLVAGVVMGATTAAIAAWALARPTSAPATAPEYSRVVRLTSGPNREVAPAVSPDAKWVAYISDAGGATNVWVRFLAGGEPVNLTAGRDLEISSGTGIGGLEISPEGTRIAVMARPRGSDAAFATWELPAPLAGVPRKLLDTNCLGMRWSPDGRRMAFISAGAAAGDGLWVADADGTNRREVLAPTDGMHMHWPSWGDDGHIYFIRTWTTVVNLDRTEIYRLDPDAGRPMEPVIQATRRAHHPLPLAGQRGIIYAANPHTAEMRLWWRSRDGTIMRQLTTGVGEYAEPRATADGSTLVSTLYELRQGLARIATQPAAAPSLSAVTDGFHGDLDPMLAPSGDRLVFSSSRAGNRHLWTARPDGSDARPLTSGTSEDDRPAYSPDGSQIAFASDRGGVRAIWIVAADGGAPRKVVDAVLSGGLTWTHDGRSIVYGAAAGGGPGLWKVAATGGTPVRLTTPFFASEPASSPARDAIAYISARRLPNGVAMSDVAFVDSNGAILHPAMPGRAVGNGFSNGVLAWSPDGRRLAVVQQQSNAPASIWLVEPEAAQPYGKIVDFPPGPRIRGMTWTLDGMHIIVGKHDWTSDIVLMDQAR